MQMSRLASIVCRALYHPAAGYVVLIASFGVTLTAWSLSLEYSNNRASDKFAFQVEEIESAVKERLNDYARLLKASVALHNASDSVDRDEWKSFISTLDLQQNYPGTQGLGVSLMISPAELGEHIRSVRDEGFADYSVRPVGSRQQYTSIVFLEPFDWRNQRAFGYDMYSEPMRKAAMDRAIETGLVSISGNVTLVQETKADVQTGFLMYTPIYNQPVEATAGSAERRAKTKAFAYAVLRGGDLMRNILAGIGNDLSLQISDAFADGQSVLFESTGFKKSDGADGLSETTAIDVYGHQWLISVRQNLDSLPRWEYWQSTFVGILGLVVNFLLFYTIHLIGKQRRGIDQKLHTEKLERANRELQRANESFERSNKDLSSFAYSASHDLKSPLRAISNLAGFIKTDSAADLSEKSLGYLNLMLVRTARLSQLLDDMLAYARIDLNTDQHDVISVRDLCHSIIGMVDIPSGYTVSTDIEVPLIQTTAAPLKRLLMNLVSNAIKHHDQANGAIEVRARWINSGVEFVVADDGPGIPKEQRLNVFDMFNTLQSRDRQEGSGMGLAFVKRLIEANGGKIEIGPNEPARRGTRVHFTWLCDAVKDSKPTAAAPALKAVATELS